MEFSYKVFEIFKDKISDLIKKKQTTLLDSITSYPLEESSWEAVKACAEKRRTSRTDQNKDSSRSHFFVLISFSFQKKSVNLIIGDLAGKENCHTAGTNKASNSNHFSNLHF